MLTVFMEHKVLSGVFLALLLLSIICQIMIGVLYRRMIRDTDNMSTTGNKLLKQFKLKFANCYQLNGGVSNIPVFVDRFIGRISLMGISLTGLSHLSGQLMLLSVVAAGVGACREIIHGETLGRILPYYIASFLGLYVWFSISGLTDIQGKKERLKINLVDYLENHMVNKLKQSQIDWAEITGGEDITKRGNTARSDRQSKKPLREGESLREKIGLSAVRGAKSMTQGDENIFPQNTAAAGAQDGQAVDLPPQEESRAVFSRQEEQELEELLREFFA